MNAGIPTLEWKRGVPTETELRDCWILDGGVQDQPCGDVSLLCWRPAAWGTHVYSKDQWYIPFKANVPGMQTVTRAKWINEQTGEEAWMNLEDNGLRLMMDNFRRPGWVKTTVTDQVVVAAGSDEFYINVSGFRDDTLYVVRCSQNKYYTVRKDLTVANRTEPVTWDVRNDSFLKDGSWRRITQKEVDELRQWAMERMAEQEGKEGE